MGDIQVKDCRHGRMMFYSNDFYIGGSLNRYGEYSEGEVALWKQFLRPGMTVVDVGANIGCFTIPLAKMVAPHGRVFAIEPQRQLYQMLTGNLALNELSNVSTLLGALGAKTGAVTAPRIDYSAPGNFGGVEINHTENAVDSVPCVPLDGLFPGTVHFIKIDVEGMERDVLDGARITIERDQPLLYVENDRQEKSYDLIQWLLDAKYRPFWHLVPLFNAKNFTHDTTNDFLGNVVSVNMLCIPDSIELRISGMHEIKGPDETSEVALVRH